MKNHLIANLSYIKHFKLLFSFLISITLLNSSCYLIKDITKSNQSICAVHNQQMYRELFWIHYGLILGCDHTLLYQKAERVYFPNSSHAKVLGGCTVGKEKWIKKWVCSKCSREDKKWQKKIENICNGLGIEEHVLCNTSFNFGVASFQENKLIESAFGFTYCYTAYPNFHMNAKAHFWLMTIFIRLGDFTLAKSHFNSAVRICLKDLPSRVNISDSLIEPLITYESDSEFTNILKMADFKESSEILDLSKFDADLRTLINSLLNPQLSVDENILNKYRYLNNKYVNSSDIENLIIAYNSCIERIVENVKTKCQVK